MQEIMDQGDREAARRAGIEAGTPEYYILKAARHRDEMNRLLGEAKDAGLDLDLGAEAVDPNLDDTGQSHLPEDAPEGTHGYYVLKAAWHREEMKRLMDKAMRVGSAQDSDAGDADSKARDTQSSVSPVPSTSEVTWMTTNFGRSEQGTFTIMRAKDAAGDAPTLIDTGPAKPRKPVRLVLSCNMSAVISASILGAILGGVSNSWPFALLGIFIGLAMGLGPMLLFSDPREHAHSVRIEVSRDSIGVGAPPKKDQSSSLSSRIALADIVRFEARAGASGSIVYSHTTSDPASMQMYGGAAGYIAGGGAGAGAGVAAGTLAGGLSATTNAIGNQIRRGRAQYKASLAETGCVVIAVVRRQPDVVLVGGFGPDVAGQLVDKLVECVEENLASAGATPQAAKVVALTDATPAAVNHYQYCRKCGGELASDDAFCGECGIKLG